MSRSATLLHGLVKFRVMRVTPWPPPVRFVCARPDPRRLPEPDPLGRNDRCRSCRGPDDASALRCTSQGGLAITPRRGRLKPTAPRKAASDAGDAPVVILSLRPTVICSKASGRPAPRRPVRSSRGHFFVASLDDQRQRHDPLIDALRPTANALRSPEDAPTKATGTCRFCSAGLEGARHKRSCVVRLVCPLPYCRVVGLDADHEVEPFAVAAADNVTSNATIRVPESASDVAFTRTGNDRRDSPDSSPSRTAGSAAEASG